MFAKGLTPILNVSNIQESFAWFEKFGWKKGWDWGSPPTFGGVCSGKCEIFLCQNAANLHLSEVNDATRQSRRLEDLLARSQVPRPRRMPSLMEGESPHRRCALQAMASFLQSITKTAPREGPGCLRDCGMAS